MTLFLFDGKTLQLNESDLDDGERQLIEKLWTLISEHGFDPNYASTGMSRGPDTGYFELSDRYWRGALCIYISGLGKAFWEVGAGFLEPWLFNSRQAIELNLKGCLHYVEWYKELIIDSFRSGRKKQIEKIISIHNIKELYVKYEQLIGDIEKRWDSDRLGHFPGLEKFILSERCRDILVELSDADPLGFRFRYPTIRNEFYMQNLLQEISWQYDESELFPVTGLPKRAGIVFDHIKVVNALHDLAREFSNIRKWMDASFAYFSEGQSGVGFI